MKDTRRSGTEKMYNLWKGFTSDIKDKINKNKINISNKQKNDRDMGDTRTPISRLDLTGMNREQAKELIGKIIDERLEMISHIEMAEPKIDHREKERQRAKAAERINERRNRRKNRSAAAVETIVTEQGVYSDYNEAEMPLASLKRTDVRKFSTAENFLRMRYKNASVFDVIQPEAFPFEQNAPAEGDVFAPIEGQLSILDAVSAEEKIAEAPGSAEPAPSFDTDHVTGEPSREDASGIMAVINKIKFSFNKKDAVDSAADPDLYKPLGFDLFGIFPYKQEKETAAAGTEAGIEAEVTEAAAGKTEAEPPAVKAAFTEVAAEKAEVDETVQEAAAAVAATVTGTAAVTEAAAPEEPARGTAAVSAIQINTSLDEAVDKVFAFFNSNKERLLLLCRKIRNRSSGILRERVLPVVSLGMRRAGEWMAPLLQKAEARLQLKNKALSLHAAISEREKKVSEKMARFVEILDRINEAFLLGVIAFKDKVCRFADQVRGFAEAHKKGLLIQFGIGVAAIAAITLTIGNATAYEYVYNGKVLGVVKNQEDVYQTIDIIGDKLSVQYDADITIDKDKDIRFNKIILAFKQDIDDKEDILNRLTYMRNMKANGKGIYVDGNLTAILESEKTARSILQEIQNEYLKKDANIQYEKVGFAEDITIKDVETRLGDIETREKVLEYMMTGAMEQKIHVVQSGETFSEIAKIYGLKQSELQISNPGVIPEKLQIGQEICLNQIVPLVTVQTTEIAQYTEEIPFDITYEDTASLYKNEQTVKSKGVKGEKDVVAEIVRNNGIEVSRNELSATILSQPVSQVVMVGTKEPPPLIGTGTFIYPIRGTLTSRYGARWGRLHAGIDLAAPIGTHIKAADGGKVTFAGYNGALGYMVEIDHGGGRVTWYGHCSKLFVKKGDKVYQGQHIANIGNTGRSTGPHVHFEVHINGKTKNPLNYL